MSHAGPPPLLFGTKPTSPDFSVSGQHLRNRGRGLPVGRWEPGKADEGLAVCAVLEEHHLAAARHGRFLRACVPLDMTSSPTCLNTSMIRRDPAFLMTPMKGGHAHMATSSAWAVMGLGCRHRGYAWPPSRHRLSSGPRLSTCWPMQQRSATLRPAHIAHEDLLVASLMLPVIFTGWPYADSLRVVDKARGARHL